MLLRRTPPRQSISKMSQLACVLCCLLHCSPLAVADEPRSETAESETQLQELYRKVSPAVVLIMLDENGKRPVGTGVIVSVNGHILTVQRTVLWDSFRHGRPVFVKLPDGRTAKGSPLGWSGEWNIALLKISDPGRWPYVKIHDGTFASSGQKCAAMEYSILTGRVFEKQPSLQIGRVTISGPPLWFATSLRPNSFAPIFSVDGDLLGVTTRKSSSPSECVATGSEVLMRCLKPLAKGKNLDREQLMATLVARGKSVVTHRVEHRKAASDKAEGHIPEVIKQSSRAAVRLTAKGRKKKWSGFIISPDGYVATCAHHKQLAGTPVTVQLSDGRDLAAKVVGSILIPDVALVRITENGEWPHVAMGNSTSLIADDTCWIVGYPHGSPDYSYDTAERQPWIRRSHIVKRDDVPWSSSLYMSKTVQTFNGDSGGGVLDSMGRLVAFHYGKNPGGYNRNGRIEIIQQHWDYLATGPPVQINNVSRSTLSETGVPFDVDISLRHTVVQIYCDGQPRIFGTIVDSNGAILTKASELFGGLSVELDGGKRLPAVIEKYSRSLDLAVLKIARSNLPCVAWNSKESTSVGMQVAAVVPNEMPRHGIISHGTRPIPIDRGAGLTAALELRVSEHGVECIDVKWGNCFDLPIKKGDFIRSVDGHKITDLASLVALLGDENNAGSLVLAVGDRISMELLRGDERMSVQLPLPPTGYFLNQSHRCSDFKKAFDTDIPLNPRLCGGPIVDTNGHVVGISIACRGDYNRRNHVLPSAVVQRFLAD